MRWNDILSTFEKSYAKADNATQLSHTPRLALKNTSTPISSQEKIYVKIGTGLPCLDQE